jgi:hypothetical protein
LDELGSSQISGTFAITSTVQGTIVARVPPGALQPAQVAIRNTHASAIVYAKWVPQKTPNGLVSSTDAGILLNAGEWFAWNPPPRAAYLICVSSVNLSPLNVDANWRVLDEAEL